MPRPLRAHPAEIELLALAVGRDRDAPSQVRGHLEHCLTCVRRTQELKTLLGAVELEAAIHEEIETTPVLRSSQDSARRERLTGLARDAETALRAADALLLLARDEDVAGRVREMGFTYAGRLALLYAAQRGLFAAAVPIRALALAEAIEAASGQIEGPADAQTRAVPPSLLRAEARLLASQSLLGIGRLADAREAASAARSEFATFGNDPFSQGLCDYFEASVLCFEGSFVRAERLLKAAARVFADFAQDHWVGRAEAVLAQALLQRGNAARALAQYDVAIEHLDPELDANTYSVCLLNRARCLARVGRIRAAQEGLARALEVANRHRLDAIAFGVRQNLAELHLLSGELESALTAFRAVAAEADQLGLEEDQVVTRLGVAECLGRLGRIGEMTDVLRRVGRLVAVTDLAGNPAWTELDSRLDPGDINIGLVSDVREHLEAARDGFVLPFRAARRA